MRAAAGPARKDFLKGLWRIKGEAPAARQREMDISVMIPVYTEEAALPELYRALADIPDRRRGTRAPALQDQAGGAALGIAAAPDCRAPMVMGGANPMAL
jgi:hypothetical protein